MELDTQDAECSGGLTLPAAFAGCLPTMTTYDHINELRAELAASIDQAERQQIAAELASAEAKLAEEDAAFEALISDEPPH